MRGLERKCAFVRCVCFYARVYIYTHTRTHLSLSHACALSQALALSPDVDRDKDEKEKGVEEMAKSGREIRVPSDASLEHALETLNNMKIEGTSRPCIIIEPGEHRCSAILEVRVQISITGTSHINAATDVVTPAIVHGVWRLCHGSGLCFSFYLSISLSLSPSLPLSLPLSLFLASFTTL